MVDTHRDPSPELRRLAKAVLDVIASLGQAAAAGIPPASEQSACQQVWCPVCALVALTRGESHPMATVFAEHGAALLAALRILADMDADGHPADGAEARPARTQHTTTGYQHIPVIVHD
jgi:hypothetical protein